MLARNTYVDDVQPANHRRVPPYQPLLEFYFWLTLEPEREVKALEWTMDVDIAAWKRVLLVTMAVEGVRMLLVS